MARCLFIWQNPCFVDFSLSEDIFFGVWKFGSIDRQALSQAWLHEQVAPFQYFGILAHLGLWGIDRWEVHLCIHIMYIYITSLFIFVDTYFCTVCTGIDVYLLYSYLRVGALFFLNYIVDVMWVGQWGFRLTMCLEPWSVARAILQALATSPPQNKRSKSSQLQNILELFVAFFHN